MGDVMCCNLSGSRHLWLWKGLCWLDNNIIVQVNEITFTKILVPIHMRLKMCITNVLKSVLIIFTRLTQ